MKIWPMGAVTTMQTHCHSSVGYWRCSSEDLGYRKKPLGFPFYISCLKYQNPQLRTK